MVREMCASDAAKAREEAEVCDGVVRIDGWMARIKESVALALSLGQLAHLPVLCAWQVCAKSCACLLRIHTTETEREVGSSRITTQSHTTVMAATKMRTPLSFLRASASLGRSVHTSILHATRPSPALSSALVLSRHASSAASTSTTPTQSQTPQLTWDEFLKLRRTRRFINLGSSALSGAASIGVAVPAFAEFEIENIGAQMTGLDPMFIIGGSLMGVGAVGWLLGPFLGTTFFNIWKGSVRKEFARVRHDPICSHWGTCLLTAFRLQKDKDFYSHIKRFRADPASSSVNNPVPDYYGEKINSVADYRRWLKDQRAFTRKKNKNLL